MLNLPAPDRTPLSSAPLPLVVAQARYSAEGSSVPADVLESVQSRLRKAGLDCPQVGTVTSADAVSIGQAPIITSNSGFQLSTLDGTWSVTLLPDSASLETRSFHSFDNQFRPYLHALLQAVSETLRPTVLQRAGLRFVNLLRSPEPGPAEWPRWVSCAVCAPLQDEVVSAGVRALMQQMALQVTDKVESTVRSGVVEAEGEPGFLLDIDTYSQPATLWSRADAPGQFDQLNEHGVALFQTLITTEMLTRLRAPAADKEEDG